MIQFFQRYVIHNFGLKFLSLLLATGLWFMIAREEQPAEVAIRAPIVFQHVPQQLEISSESIPEAQIRVRAPERTIRQLKANEVQAEIDLTGVNSGERTFDLTSHQVQIRPRVTGNFATGEQIVKVDADPPWTTITGPRHHVDKIEAATTDPIDATGTLGSAVFTTNVYVPDPLVQVEQAGSIRVTVVVQKVGGPAAH